MGTHGFAQDQLGLSGIVSVRLRDCVAIRDELLGERRSGCLQHCVHSEEVWGRVPDSIVGLPFPMHAENPSDPHDGLAALEKDRQMLKCFLLLG